MAFEWLDEIERRAEAATPGPWVVMGDSNRVSVWTRKEDAASDLEICAMNPLHDGADPNDNAQFIAHARTDVLRLCRTMRLLISTMEDCLVLIRKDARRYALRQVHGKTDEPTGGIWGPGEPGA